MIPWNDIVANVLAKEPKAKPFLDIVGKYWGDGKLTEDVANRFLAAWMGSNYIEAKRILYGSMAADDLIAADKVENEKLAAMIVAERKLYNFGAELGAAVLKVALGVVLAALGF